MAHKVVRDAGYESEPTDWENLFATWPPTEWID